MIAAAVHRWFENVCDESLPLWDIKLRRLLAIYEWFTREGLADKNFDKELTNDASYRERLSELLIAYKLMRAGYRLTSDGAGPDLWASKGSNGFWVEIITPRPMSIDPAYIEQVGASADGMLNVPSDQILRRWTAAIDAKAQKLRRYLDKGYVQSDQPFVIAVNGRSLRGDSNIGFNGVSMNPCAVEVLFGLGSLGLKSIAKGKITDVRIGRSHRSSVDSINRASIPMTTFLDDANAQISGVWAMDIDENEVLLDPLWPGLKRGYFSCAGIFNPFAANPLAPGDLPTFEDWTCQVTEDSYQLTHHNRIPFDGSS